jgi:hypothetical protein
VKQVAGETFTQLLENDLPLLVEHLRQVRQSLDLPDDAPLDLTDGRFVAPEHPANRAAVRDDPALPRLILPVDAQAFFRPLPGWPAAQALARIEGVALERVTSVEAVERYYRLGAGAQGALLRLATPLFEARPPSDFDAVLAIQQLRQRGQAATLNALLVHLDRRLAERRDQEERLNAVARQSYPFGRLRADLARLAVPRAVLDSRGAIGRAHAEVVRELGSAVRAAGRDLVRSGVAVEDALTRLAAETTRWATLGQQYARPVAERLRGTTAA